MIEAKKKELSIFKLYQKYPQLNCKKDVKKVVINENTLIGPYCLIQASNHGYRMKGPIKGQEYTHAPISIGKGSWLAANVIVLPGIVIEDGAVIGASAVVTKNIEANSINAGNPSKRISYRDL